MVSQTVLHHGVRAHHFEGFAHCSSRFFSTENPTPPLTLIPTRITRLLLQSRLQSATYHVAGLVPGALQGARRPMAPTVTLDVIVAHLLAEGLLQLVVLALLYV